VTEEAAADVFAVVAHRLLGSVAAIRGAAALLSRPELAPDRREELASLLRDETEQLDDLVRGLLRGELGVGV